MRHSVALNLSKCLGCTTCIKSCPTEAIRVRSRKATILPNRCIDCGTCIQVCPHQAVRSQRMNVKEALQRFKYNIAIPDPSLYGQFHNLDDANIVLNALLTIGFDDIFEAGTASEMLAATLDGSEGLEAPQKPELSPACPAVVRLICIRFPDLLNHLPPLVTPIELAAILARKQAVEAGVPAEDIGVFSIVPCSSQVTAVSAPEGLEKPVLDGALAIRDVYLELLGPMRDLDKGNMLPLAGSREGTSWAFSGGEALTRRERRYIAVDGIVNVIRMLEEIEDGRMPDADFIELRACTNGCLGGCLNVENPFTAKMHLKDLMGNLPPSPQWGVREDVLEILRSTKEPVFLPTFQLDPNRRVAMQKMMAIQTLEEQLPGLRCGSCGAPSCRAFAEDVVMGRASVDDCIFKVRERMQHMAGDTEADDYMPAPFRLRRKQPAPETDCLEPMGPQDSGEERPE